MMLYWKKDIAHRSITIPQQQIHKLAGGRQQNMKSINPICQLSFLGLFFLHKSGTYVCMPLHLPLIFIDPESLTLRQRYITQIQIRKPGTSKSHVSRIWTHVIYLSQVSMDSGDLLITSVQPGNAIWIVNIYTICYYHHPGNQGGHR